MRIVGFHFLPIALLLALCLPAQANSDDAGQDGTRVKKGKYRIPVNIPSLLRPNLLRVNLYASRDAGKTWYLFECIPADGKAFSFEAPEDGTYWLAVQRINRDGSAEPRDALLRPNLTPVEPAQPKYAKGAVQNLKADVKALREQLERVEQRLSELLEKPTVK